jgi:hypothetical protein
MGLSTTDLPVGGGLPKTITPGNHELKINRMELEEFTFIPGAYHVMLHVETAPIEGFEGFLIDKDDESKGHYKGQIGRIKASQYAFADGETKSGVKIQRDRSIMIFMQNLCKAYDIQDWFTAQDGLHETIEDLVKAFNNKAPFKEKYLSFCVAGKEYVGKTGYTNYDLYLPKAEKSKYSFAAVGDLKVMTYDEVTHLKKTETKEVKSFGDDENAFPTPKKSSSDFLLN